jgi:hypothetical protein
VDLPSGLRHSPRIPPTSPAACAAASSESWPYALAVVAMDSCPNWRETTSSRAPAPRRAWRTKRYWESLVSWNPDDKGVAEKIWGTRTDPRAIREQRVEALAKVIGSPATRRAHERRDRQFRRLVREIRG